MSNTSTTAIFNRFMREKTSSVDSKATRNDFKLEAPTVNDVDCARSYAIAAQAAERASSVISNVQTTPRTLSMGELIAPTGAGKSGRVGSLFGPRESVAQLQQGVSTIRGENMRPAPTLEKVA